ARAERLRDCFAPSGANVWSCSDIAFWLIESPPCSLRARARHREGDELQALRPFVLRAGSRLWLLVLHPVGALARVGMKPSMYQGSVARCQAPFLDREQMRPVLAACSFSLRRTGGL